MSETTRDHRMGKSQNCVAFGWGLMRCNTKTWILIMLLVFAPARFFGFSLVFPACLAVALANRFMKTPSTASLLHTLPVSFKETAHVLWVESALLVPLGWFGVQVVERIWIGEYYTYPIPFLAKLVLATVGFASLCGLPFVLGFYMAPKPPYTKALKEPAPMAIPYLFGIFVNSESERIGTWLNGPIVWFALAVAVGSAVFAYVLPQIIVHANRNTRTRTARRLQPIDVPAYPTSDLPGNARYLGTWSAAIWAGCLTLVFFVIGFIFQLYICEYRISSNVSGPSAVLFITLGVPVFYLMNAWSGAVRALRALPLGPDKLILFYIKLIAPAAGFPLCFALCAYAFGFTIALPFLRCITLFILWVPLLYSLSLRFGKDRGLLVVLSVLACFFVPNFAIGPVEIMLWALIGLIGWLYLRYRLINDGVIYRSSADR